MIRAHLLAVLVLAAPALATAQQARDGAVIVMSSEGLVQVGPTARGLPSAPNRVPAIRARHSGAMPRP